MNSSATDNFLPRFQVAAARSNRGRWLSFQFTRYNRSVNLDDTIVAIATPPGRGGIGVVRVAGPQAREITAPMLRLKHDLEPGRAVFGELIELSQEHVAPASRI